MKICLIGPVYPYRGGIAHYTAMLAQSLLDNGHDIFVVSFTRQYPAFLYPGKTDQDTSREPIQVSAEYILDPLYPWTWLKCVKRVRSFSPDLIIFQWWTTFWAPAYYAVSKALKQLGFKICYLVHNIFPHEKHEWDRFLAYQALRQANMIIVQAEAEKQKLAKLLHDSPATLIPHPIYGMLASKKFSKDDAKSKLGIEPRKLVLLFFGIVRPYKGLRYLLEAIPLVLEHYDNIVLVVAGEFWEKQKDYHELCGKLGIKDHVKIFNFYIPNEDIPLYFGAADIFVAPYVNSTQSGVVKIAMAYNLPIVASHCVIDEILNDDEFVFPTLAGDPVDLAHTISRVIDQGPLSISRGGSDWNVLVKSIEQIGRT